MSEFQPHTYANYQWHLLHGWDDQEPKPVREEEDEDDYDYDPCDDSDEDIDDLEE